MSGGAWVGEAVWWLEAKPGEGGRYAVRNSAGDVLPSPWNARTRVHEYGGGSWAVAADSTLVFAEFTDQRLYRLAAGSSSPEAITPADVGFRFADLAIRDSAEHGIEVIAVRETHVDGLVRRDIVAVPLHSTGTAGEIRSIVAGAHFLAFPRFSPDGTHIAWIGWEHPQMPWDGTELWVRDLVSGATTVLMGSTTESVLQPEWVDDATLRVSSDRSGWWNLYTVSLFGTVSPMHRADHDFGGALWQLGEKWHEELDDGRVLAVRTLGQDSLVVIDPDGDGLREISLPLTSIELGARNGHRVLLLGGSSTVASGLRVLDLRTGSLSEVRLDVDALPDAGVLAIAESRTFGGTGDGSREVHAFVYPPTNAAFAAPEGELPPYIAFVHGGPTSRAVGGFRPTIAYFTSRGFGVVDINYGGSTGYGREYRNRLRGQWGVVDVEDVITAMHGLADAGLADPARLAIRGGSAGGFTVLAALTSSDVFAAGVSYFGVGDLRALAEDTHDFESRYLDGLIGPLPAAAALYDERSPLSNVNRLTTPVLLLQGLDDPVVPPAQAESFRDALAAKGLAHAYVAYPGESHGFRRTETIIDATESELSFYGQLLAFTPADIPTLPLD